MFNKKATIKSSLEETAIKNKAGGMGFTLSPYMDLYLRTVSTLVGENKNQ